MANTAVKAVKSGEGIQDALKGLELAAQKVVRHTKELADYERLLREHRKLQYEIKVRDEKLTEQDSAIHERDDKIREQKSALSQMTEEFARSTTVLQQERDQARRELGQQKERASEFERRIKATAGKELAIAQSEAQRYADELKEATASLDGYKAKLQRSENSIASMHATFGILRTADQIGGQAERLALELHAFAIQYGKLTVPDTIDLQDELFMLLHRSQFMTAVPEAIPISTTPASVALRTAGLEAIIIRQLADHLFIPFFPCRVGEFDTILYSLTHTTEGSDPSRQAALQSLIASARSENFCRREESARTAMVANVCNIFDPMLQPNAGRTDFEVGLRKLVSKASDLWKCIQRNQPGMSVICTDRIGEGWDLWPSNGEIKGQDFDEGTEISLAVLFPQISQRSGNANKVLYSGIVLWSDQEQVIAARQEHRLQRSRIQGRSAIQNDRGKRRRSLGGNIARVQTVTDALAKV